VAKRVWFCIDPRKISCQCFHHTAGEAPWLAPMKHVAQGMSMAEAANSLDTFGGH